MPRPRTEHIPRALHGLWRDRIERRDDAGRVTLVDEGEFRPNLIVASLPVLLSGLMANEASFAGGLLYHAIGEGDPGWDTALDPPRFEQTRLVNEHYRKRPDSIVFMDAEGHASATPTSTLEVRTTFDFADAGANGRFIRTQGLVGGDATAQPNTGLLVNAIHHPAIWKDESVRLTRFIRLFF